MRPVRGEHPDLPDELQERLEADRRAGELDSAMQSGSDDTPEIAIGTRFAGELTPEEALRALVPTAPPPSPARRPRRPSSPPSPAGECIAAPEGEGE